MIYSVPPFSLIKKGVILPQFYKKRSYKIILFPQFNTPVPHMPQIYSKLNTFKKTLNKSNKSYHKISKNEKSILLKYISTLFCINAVVFLLYKLIKQHL